MAEERKPFILTDEVFNKLAQCGDDLDAIVETLDIRPEDFSDTTDIPDEAMEIFEELRTAAARRVSNLPTQNP